MDNFTWCGNGEVIEFKDKLNADKCVALMQSVIASERERCAKIAEIYSPGDSQDEYAAGRNDAGAEIAAKIRNGE